MNLENEYLKTALQLHRNNPVVDAHLDLPGEILYRVLSGEKDIIRNYYLGNWKRCGLNLIVVSVFLEDSVLPEMGLRNALDQIAVLKEEIARNDEIVLVKSRQDLKNVLAENKIGFLLYAEGLDFIGADKRLIDIFYELGVRGAALTWSRNNLFATGCCRASERVQRYGGLTYMGMEMVEYLENKGIFIDVSHLNDDGFREMSILAKKPFIATHSACREVFFNYRNLTDEQMVKLARQGGILGINGHKLVAGVKEEDNPILKICEHIFHAIKIMGISHVGYGFDFCDSYNCAMDHKKEIEDANDCLGNHSGVPLLTATLLSRGMPEDVAVKVIGGNFVDYFMRNLPKD